MAADSPSNPSFSPRRKWSIGLNVCLLVLSVFSVVVMLNYLGRDYRHRLYLTAKTKNPLSPRTVRFLQSFTNRVTATIYYDKDDPFYTTVAALLNDYKYVNPRITVQTVDYTRDAGAAQQLLGKYKFLAQAAAKNLVIFDCDGKYKGVEGKLLAKYDYEREADEKEINLVKRATQFLGEMAFTAALLDVTSPRQFKACYLKGHGEPALDDEDKVAGYSKFASLLDQNYLKVEPLFLLGTNPVPADCNLLIVAAPATAMLDSELERIDRYLNQGGRLLSLFNAEARDRITGLENTLTNWGVRVGGVIIQDPDHSETGSDVVASAFSNHPLVNPLIRSGIYFIRPRPVGRLRGQTQAADAAKVDELVFSGPNSVMEGIPARKPQLYPLAVAVEKGDLKGVITDRGTTRIVVAGDSTFLNNRYLDNLANRDFANCAVNWLLERKQLFEGLGPRPITQYRYVMTKPQLQSVVWILLAVMPGAVLLAGALVWLRRRR